MYWAAPRPHIYRGRGGGCAPSRVPTPRGAAALDGSWGGGQEGERGAPPRVGLRAHLSLGFPLLLLCCALGLVGGAPAHLGAGPSPPLAHASLRGMWPHLVDPRDPPGGPSTLPINPKTLPVTKTGLPIYKSLPPNHFETPRDVWDLIRESEQHSVTTYIYSL